MPDATAGWTGSAIDARAVFAEAATAATPNWSKASAASTANAASAARKWVARCARGGAWSARALASKRPMRSMVLVGRLASSARSAVVLGDDRDLGNAVLA